MSEKVAGWRRWMGIGLVVLGIAMVAGFTLFMVSLLGIIEDQRVTIGNLQQDSEYIRKIAGILEAEHPVMVRLSSPAGREGWRGILFWARGTGEGLLQIGGIVPADTVQSYRLWIHGDGEPLSMRSFRVSVSSPLFVLLEDLPEGQTGRSSILITTDPDGNGSFASGAIVMAGSLPEQTSQEIAKEDYE